MKQLFCFLILLFSVNLLAQTVDECGTPSPFSQPGMFTPQQLLKQQIMEEAFARYKAEGTLQQGRGVLSIPVVVHIIHRGEAVGVGANLTDAQVQTALTETNKYLRDYYLAGTDMQIELCLASLDTLGNPTNGINRVNGSVIGSYDSTGITNGNSCSPNNTTQVKALSRWPHKQYLNIWVVWRICSTTGTIAGYGTYPWNYDSPNDGIVVRYTSFTAVKTVVHEVGHVLGLYHTFEGDDNDTACPDDDDCILDGDRCCDTQPHKRGDCSSNVCTGAGNWSSTAINHMSYCSTRELFTPGQKERAHFYLNDLGTDLSYLLLSDKCSSRLPATVWYATHGLDDGITSGGTGNGNGKAQPAETVELTVELHNMGPDTAREVEVVLVTADADIEITRNRANYGNMAVAQYKSLPGFQFKVLAGTAEKDVKFYLNIATNEGFRRDSITVHIYGNQVSVSEVASYPEPLLYPNPANNLLQVQYNLPVVLALYNSMGMLVQTYNTNTTNGLYISNLPTGYYVASITTPHGVFKRSVQVIR